MQNYGFMRLYDAKAGTSSPRRARLDFALLMTASLFVLSLNMGLFSGVLVAMHGLGLSPITDVWHVRAVQVVCGAATAAALIAWVVEARKHRSRQQPRLCFLVSLVAAHLLMNTTSNIFLLSAQEKVYHSLQYVSLTWHYSRRRAERAPDLAGSGFRALFAAHRWPHYLVVVAVMTAITVLANRELGGSATGPCLFTALFGGVALCHYYFDSFLWRARRPEVRASL